MNKLSVIVPVYNEEKNIRRSLKKLGKTLYKIPLESEIIIVSDGSTDNTEGEVKKAKFKNTKFYKLPKNMGKGHAIKEGFYKTSGDIVAFIDGDLDLNPKKLADFLNYLNQKKGDIVIGSKRHPESKVIYPPTRRIMSFGYQNLIWLLFNLSIKDTQVGLKLFRRQVLSDILPRIVVKRFAFDLELLVVANHLGYKKIIEAPIELKYRFSSSISPKDVRNIIQDTAAIFYRLKILKYYDKK